MGSPEYRIARDGALDLIARVRADLLVVLAERRCPWRLLRQLELLRDGLFWLRQEAE